MWLKDGKQYLVGTLNERNSTNCSSIAANNFHWNLIDFMRLDNVLSINSMERVCNQDIKVKYLFTKYRLIYFIKSTWLFLWSFRFKSPIFYNLEWYTVHLFLFALVLGRKPRVIALDMSINIKLYKLLLFLSKNPIVLRTSFLFNEKQRHVLFPGFISFNALEKDFSTSNRPLRFILCGSLGPNTGLIEYCFLAETYRDIEFHLAGVAHRISQDELNEIVEKYNSHANINYHGGLDRLSFEKLLSSCDIGFTLRSQNIENEYNFPSKILEFISFGLVPISTVDYFEYGDFRIFNLKDLPSLINLKKSKMQNIAEHNLRVLRNYNKVERFL